MATADIELKRFFYQDWQEAYKKYPNVHFRYMISLHYDASMFIYYNKTNMNRMFSRGENDALHEI